jgi:hypothetical protein
MGDYLANSTVVAAPDVVRHIRLVQRGPDLREQVRLNVTQCFNLLLQVGLVKTISGQCVPQLP